MESHKSCYQNQRDVVLSLQLKKDFEGHVRVKMIMDKVALTWYALYVHHVSVQYEDYGSHPSTKKKSKKKKMGTGPCGKILHCTFQ